MLRFYSLFPFLLFLFSILVRLVFAVLTRFDGLYGQDAFAYFNYALALREAVSTGSDLPSFEWPVGYPALVVLAMFIIGPQASAGQIVSLLAGAAIAPIVYLLVLEIRPQTHWGGVAAPANNLYPTWRQSDTATGRKNVRLCPLAVYLFINPKNVQSQWAGKTPALHFTWLQTHTRLIPIADYRPFVLYRVE